MEKAGVKFDKGLSVSEIKEIEAKYEFIFPPDLKEFLQFSLPIGKSWVDWRNGKEEEIKSRLDWGYEGICFDIEHSKFWLENWGEKPTNLEDAFQIAKTEIAKAPKLIPIFSHRFIPDRPNVSGNPIFSVYQTDIIIYGVNLPIYLQNEFSSYFEEKKNLQNIGKREIEFWSELAG
ncbi:MAG: SMI1/KNR4 family protein [Acidobacteriota bacterium]|nr:SMI1/KNR4 family protein [Acidobacteriota bacterium]